MEIIKRFTRPNLMVTPQTRRKRQPHSPMTQRFLAGIVAGFALAAAVAASGQTVGVGNLVYVDADRNGRFNSGDLPVPNVRVELYTEAQSVPGVPVAVRTTDSAGRFMFTGLAAGRYRLFLPPANFAPNAPLGYVVSIPGEGLDDGLDDDVGENGVDEAQPAVNGVRSVVFGLAAGTEPVNAPGTETGSGFSLDSVDDANVDLTIDFGFQSTRGRIGDRVWLDSNRNGLQDAGEAGLGGVRVQLFEWQSGEFVDSVESTSTGEYGFTGLPPGDYFVRFPTETYSADGMSMWRLTVPDAGSDDNVDSDGSLPDGETGRLIVPAGGNLRNVDGGYYFVNGGVGDLVWRDDNSDGEQSPGEPGLGGVTVTLLTSTGMIVAQQVTNPAGEYFFPEVPPGDYYLEVPLAAGSYRLTAPLQSSPLTDSDADQNTGRTAVFSVFSGVQDGTWDIGYAPSGATVEGSVWLDAAPGDGIRAGGEGLLTASGLSVALHVVGSPLPPRVVSVGANGRFVFTDVPPGNYQLAFPRYAGARNRLILTLQDQGASDAVDSDASPADGFTASFTVGAGGSVMRDAGYRPVALGLGNLVYIDRNDDGGFDAGEGVQNVRVELHGPWGSESEVPDMPSSGTPPAAFTLTSVAGTYYFEGLEPGWYLVSVPGSQFAAGAPLAGMVSMPGASLAADKADDSFDENGRDAVVPRLTGVSAVVQLVTAGAPALATGEDGWEAAWDDERGDADFDLTIDFAFVRGLSAGNLVFRDADGDSRFDAGEGVAGVTVEAWLSGTTPGQGTPAASVTTDADGGWLLSGLTPGSYLFHVPARNFAAGAALDGMVSLPGAGGDDAMDDGRDENGLDGTVPAVAGVSSVPVLLQFGSEPLGAGGEDGFRSAMDDAFDDAADLTIDFGFAPAFIPVAMGNRVWIEADGDGAFDAGEGVAGVPLQLFNAADDRQVAAPLATVLTAADGAWQMSGLRPGVYVVRIPPTAFAPGGPLHDVRSLPGTAADDGRDDHLPASDNGIDAELPALSGIVSIAIALVPGAEPEDATGEAGAGAAEDAGSDADADLTCDLGFYRNLPASFGAWRLLHGLPAGAGPLDDADGDGAPNVLEYALHQPPTGGPSPRRPFTMTVQPDGQRVDVSLTRNPAAADVTVTVEVLADLSLSPGGWAALTAPATETTTHPDGSVTLRWQGVQSAPGLTAAGGNVRVRVSGVGGAVAALPPLGWRERSMPVGFATGTQSFLKAALLAGRVESQSGSTLSLPAAAGNSSLATMLAGQAPLFLQVLSGPHAGHRFELTETATGAVTLVIDGASPLNTMPVPALTGATVSVRAHWTVGELFPAAAFLATNNPATSDRVLWHDGSAFQTMMPFDFGGGQRRWAWVNDPNITDRGAMPVPPGAAFFSQIRAGGLTLLASGEVPVAALALPLRAGLNFLGNPSPVAVSPAGLGLNAAGFAASTNPAAADSFLTWRGDRGAGATWDSCFLLDPAPDPAFWVNKADPFITDQTLVPLFRAGRGFFLQLRAARSGFQLRPGWTP